MSPVKMSKFESAMRTALDYQKALNNQDIPGMMELMSDDCAFESAEPAPDGELYSGKDEIAAYWRDYFNKKNHLKREIEEVFSTGERCILRWKSFSLGAVGEKGYLRGVDIFQVGDGAINQILSYAKGGSGGFD